METLKLPRHLGWCAIWFDESGHQHVIEGSYTKSKARAIRIADEYMLEHQVKTGITECIF